ncbi:MAG: hypothetical protein MJZ88_03280 [Paludibacteraceae bacterium]|nr:hypothetical protein [Paludibacteraceae bacterium]
MNKKLISACIALLLVGIGALVYINIHQKREMTEMVELLEFEKEELEDEYEDLSIQFDGYQQLDIHNDSLQELLSKEQQRVKDLLEELRITKVTNARRIAELKKELATVRSVMVVYVHQIDSLSQLNENLTKQNREYRQQYQEVTQANEQLTEQNTKLEQVVTRASMLEISNFSVVTLNKRDRKTGIFSQIQKLEIHYTLLKNITCEPGIKTVYLQLRRPDGEVMTKSMSNTFAFENGTLDYSIKQEVEYEGEELSAVMYWPVEEILQTGTYNADFFVDGNLIASYPFALKK